MLQVIVPFGLLDFNSNPSWFNRDLIILIALLSICIFVSFVSLQQSRGKLSFPKSNLLLFLLNLHLSISILVLVLLTRKAFIVFSTLENPLGRVYNSLTFISTLIFVSIFLLLSCSKFILSFLLVQRKNTIWSGCSDSAFSCFFLNTLDNCLLLLTYKIDNWINKN